MKSKKVLAGVCAALILLQTTFPALAAEVPTYEQYRGGSYRTQQADKVYTRIEIGTEEELRKFAADCSVDEWSRDKLVILTDNISLTGADELCIPVFGGYFDGAGHHISNLEITSAGSDKGLFRYVQDGGIVKGLTVEGRVAPDGTAKQVGGIVGVNYGLVENCSFTGTVIGDTNVGGIAGSNAETGEIRRCKNAGVILGDHSAGGIAGSNDGILNNCGNSGKINTYSTEVTYDLDDFSVDNLEKLNSTSNVAAHTDTGGIAGVSGGKIYFCVNTGDIGYEHVGYNIGGIVGRLHQGYLQSCTNNGHVLGRKDVGGMAGQMEPFLEIQYLSDKLQELDRETDKFLDLLDATYDEISKTSRDATQIARQISGSLKGANAAGKELSTAAVDLWYIYNQELGGVSNDIRKLNDDLADVSGNNGMKPDPDDPPREVEGMAGSEAGNVTADSPLDDISGNNPWDDISGNNPWFDISGNDSWPDISGNDDWESYKTALKKFGESASGHIDTMTDATESRESVIKNNLELLNKNLDDATNSLEALADLLEKSADTNSGNMDALTEQARVLRKLTSEIRDDLFRYEGISIEDTSDEPATDGDVTPGAPGTEKEVADEALYDTSGFQKGKITLCINRGTIEADTNVGGIVGQIATEYDFDPEEDITLSGAESFDVEQTVKAVVRDSRNTGKVTGKKDCVGGIAGKADYGAIISCESYADVESTGGSNVGGIAGSADYAIRSCYSMGNITGKNYVGGITGRGCDIFYSYACNTVSMSGEAGGGIAGSLKDNGTMYGNYYVEGGLDGVDGIGYENGACPISYEELSNMENVPDAFTYFTVTFMADDKEVAKINCTYGSRLSDLDLPEVPEKEGYYGSWPEIDEAGIRSNTVLNAEYREWIASVASEDTVEGGKAVLMAAGEFYPGACLSVTQEDGVYRYRVENPKEDTEKGTLYQGEVTLRVYCEDSDNCHILVEKNGNFEKTDSRVIGSYIEFTADAEGTFKIGENSKNSTLLITGIAVAAVAVIVGIVLLCRHRHVRRNKKQKENND